MLGKIEDGSTVDNPVIKEYIFFERLLDREKGKKTQVWDVVSKSGGYSLGELRWYGPWRQYVFFPERETLFNEGCLRDIKDFIVSLMNQWRASKA